METMILRWTDIENNDYELWLGPTLLWKEIEYHVVVGYISTSCFWSRTVYLYTH